MPNIIATPSPASRPANPASSPLRERAVILTTAVVLKLAITFGFAIFHAPLPDKPQRKFI